MSAFTTALLVEVSFALGLNQRTLGELLGVSARTIQRWQRGGTTLLPSQVARLAAALHPRDPALAERVAKAGGTSLAELQVGTPPRAPTLRHLVDSMVCAAADAMDVLPSAVRPALAAAFGRAYEMGVSVETVQAELAPAAPAASGKPKVARGKS
jgi:hypothetical protein